MPKLRKSTVQEENEESQSFGKYLNFEEKETEIPEPINEKLLKENSPEQFPKSKPASNKKAKRSLKKQNLNDEESIEPVERTAKRKSRRKKIDESPQKTECENDEERVMISPKPEKKEKSSRKNKKSSKKNKNNQSEEEFSTHEDEFNDNELRQQEHSNNQVPEKKEIDEDERSNKSVSEQSAVNFNKRLKKKKEVEKEDFNILLSRYNEDEQSNAFANKLTEDDSSNGEIGTRYESDLRDFDILAKKKEKKEKKDTIKIKNKYFSDLTLAESNEKYEPLEGEDPPENSEELIIEKREPRKTIYDLNQVIEKRVNHVKERREFKSSENDMKFKNHIKTKLQEVKDVEEVEVDIEVPNLFKKKTASAALYMKNTLETEEKMSKFSQQNTENDKKLHKAPSNLENSQSVEMTTIEQRKKQEFEHKLKKKGLKRDDFFSHLTKEIKSKRQTNMDSQEIKECFKTSQLDKESFDDEFVEEVISNCSSRSGSRESFSRIERKMSVDSQKSHKSHESMKESKERKEIIKDSLTGSIARPGSKWNIEMNNDNNADNSNSKSFFTNRSSRHLANLVNPPISEVKESDASSSYKNIGNSRSFAVMQPVLKLDNNTLRFDNEVIKEEVQKAFPKTYQMFESDNELYEEKNEEKHSEKEKLPQNPEIRTTHEIIEAQKVSDKKLYEKLENSLKKEKKNKKEKEKEFDVIDDMLGDNLDEENDERKEKKSKKRKNKKQKFEFNDYENYFEDEAEYSSDEEGHTDEEFESEDSDLDEEGNIIGLIDKDTKDLKLNERRVKKKFLEDEYKKDKEILQRIMKGMNGRKKAEETESEKKLRKRMEEAAKRNLLDDLDEINGTYENINETANPLNTAAVETEKLEEIENENDENSKEMRKLKEMEEQLAIGGHGRRHYEGTNGKESSINEAWKHFHPILPVRNNVHHPLVVNRPSMGEKRVSVDRNKEHRKSIFDTKKGSVQQEIFNKTITTDRPRADSTGNRNKLQKTSEIHLDIRNINANYEDEVEI